MPGGIKVRNVRQTELYAQKRVDQSDRQEVRLRGTPARAGQPVGNPQAVHVDVSRPVCLPRDRRSRQGPACRGLRPDDAHRRDVHRKRGDPRPSNRPLRLLGMLHPPRRCGLPGREIDVLLRGGRPVPLPRHASDRHRHGTDLRRAPQPARSVPRLRSRQPPHPKQRGQGHGPQEERGCLAGEQGGFCGCEDSNETASAVVTTPARGGFECSAGGRVPMRFSQERPAGQSRRHRRRQGRAVHQRDPVGPSNGSPIQSPNRPRIRMENRRLRCRPPRASTRLPRPIRS